MTAFVAWFEIIHAINHAVEYLSYHVIKPGNRLLYAHRFVRKAKDGVQHLYHFRFPSRTLGRVEVQNEDAAHSGLLYYFEFGRDHVGRETCHEGLEVDFGELLGDMHVSSQHT